MARSDIDGTDRTAPLVVQEDQSGPGNEEPPPVRKPCASCPWRVDQHAWSIPGFDLQKAEGLISTTSTELGAPQFACHQSREGEEVVCVGWLARYGWDNIGVRLGLLQGHVNPAQLDAAQREDWPMTHETFEEVISKLRDDCT